MTKGDFMGRISARSWSYASLALILGMGMIASAAKAESLAAKEFGYGQLESNIAFSPDGKAFVAGSAFGKVRIFDLASGTVLRTFSGDTDRIQCVAYSPDGATILAGDGSRSQSVRLWDVSTGACLKTFTGHTRSISSVAYAPDGATMLTGSMDGSAKLWSQETGLCLRTLQVSNDYTRIYATFLRDGKSFLTAAGNKAIRWDAATGDTV